MAQYKYISHNNYWIIPGTSSGLRSRVGLIGGYVVYERETALNVWEEVSAEIPEVTGNRCRLGVRNSNWCVDYEITALGFAGVEDTDWKNTSEIEYSWSTYWSTRTVSGVNITPDSETQLTVSWTNNGISDYTGHKLYISTDNITYSLSKTVSSIGTSTTLTGLTANTLYYVKVAPYRNTNIGTLSTADSDYTWSNQIGNIITDTFARADLGSNWSTGLTTTSIALDGSKMIWSFASGAANYNDYCCWKNLMSLERWECEIVFEPSKLEANSYGACVRFESSDAVNNFDMSIQLNTTNNGTYRGLVYILNNANAVILYQTPTQLTVHLTDSYKLRVKREKNIFTVYGENMVDHSTVSGSYTLPISYSQTTFPPNQGKLGFQIMRGVVAGGMNYKFTSCVINSEARANPKTAVIGDSISVGVYASLITDRYFDKLFGTTNGNHNLMASCGDKIATLVSRESEIVLYKPHYALIMIGANDATTNHTTWQTSYETFLDYLIANGITPIVCYPTPQTTDITWMNTIIDTICATRSLKVINTFTPLKAVADNTLHADYNCGDNLHINAAGHTVIANTILAAAPEVR